MSTWATIADVTAATGRVIPQATIDQAEGHLSIVTGAVPEYTVGRLARRDIYWLKLALAHQAVWEADQPDLYTRTDVSSLTQDGVSATLKPDALVLAPLARRALKRLSWRGPRTLNAVQSRQRPLSPLVSDEGQDWQPLAMP